MAYTRRVSAVAIYGASLHSFNANRINVGVHREICSTGIFMYGYTYSAGRELRNFEVQILEPFSVGSLQHLRCSFRNLTRKLEFLRLQTAPGKARYKKGDQDDHRAF